MKKGRILIIDDNKNVLNTLRILLSNYFEEVILLPSPNTLITTLKEKNPDVTLLDMNFSAGRNTGNEGLFWLSEIKKTNPDIPVVLFTAYADIELAVKALKEGATDFIVKPWDNAKLIATLQSAYALYQSRKEVKRLKEKQKGLSAEINRKEEICWGESQLMQDLFSKIEKVAPTDANILITGENGTGKEVVAKTIHNLSLRKKEPFVTVDMGSITSSLFESELFGHMKGSFTDAHADKLGKFEVADNGTLFLDEIGNLALTQQPKLLRTLQTREIIRIGSNQPIAVNIRLICATNANLFQAVKEGIFREDLLYRINTIHLEVPPLRERKEDIPQLADFFLNRYQKKYNKKDLTFSAEALEKLKKYIWPGNVRELQHAIEKAVILTDDTILRPSDFYTR
ncbi:MAG: sigma-54-dependent Fis family transcriptional regulator, partial [Bacteroidales bacterium]|nr:sigma-54-dependent Fis family transcriptional regulator [Bacteroidales bacterium]